MISILTYCDSPDKSEGLCETCLRDINLADIEDSMMFDTWQPREVKDLSTKTTVLKCTGYMKDSKCI